MKSLGRSIISSSCMWMAHVLFGYFTLIQGVIKTGSMDYLIFGNNGKMFLGSVGYCLLFVFVTALLYKRTLLPCYEMLIRKQVVEKITRLDWLRVETAGAYLPWSSVSYMRISNEKGVFSFPDYLSDEMKVHRVHIRFLRRSKLVLQISVVE